MIYSYTPTANTLWTVTAGSGSRIIAKYLELSKPHLGRLSQLP